LAAAVGRKYGAKVYALHVVVPGIYGEGTSELEAMPIQAKEEAALEEFRRVGSQFIGLDHEVLEEHGLGVWMIVEKKIQDRRIDLLVLGTRGRNGVRKLAWGSLAGEIFGRSPVPILSIGPAVQSGGADFRRILFVTDFTPDAAYAIPYAVSLARENDARLILAHVMPHPGAKKSDRPREMSVAEVIHHLYEMVPKDANLPLRPEVAVEFGKTSEQIVKAAKERNIHLIVLGVRCERGYRGSTTHFGGDIAQQVAACSPCPILTIRA